MNEYPYILDSAQHVRLLPSDDGNGNFINIPVEIIPSESGDPISVQEASGSLLLQALEDVKTAVENIEISTDNISIDATDINLNLNEVEQLISGSNLELQKVVKNTIKFYTEDVEEDTSTLTTYVGKQSVDGQWMVQKIVDTIVGTITTTTLQYATVVNNTTKTTYANAWTDRTTLTYSEIKNLL